MFIRKGPARGLQARFRGETHQLIEDEGVLRFATPFIDLAMDSESMAVLESSLRHGSPHASPVNPEDLASMIILHRSFAESMPEFPRSEAADEWLVEVSPSIPGH